MIEKEFITYEPALALKELGFDDECIATFTDGVLMIHGKQSLDSIKGSGLHNRHLGDSGRIITAPTYSQCFRWFRDKHELVVSQDRDGGWWMFSIKTVFDEDNEGACEVPDGYITKDTYEEAELECLKKLIEIVKTK